MKENRERYLGLHLLEEDDEFNKYLDVKSPDDIPWEVLNSYYKKSKGHDMWQMLITIVNQKRCLKSGV